MGETITAIRNKKIKKIIYFTLIFVLSYGFLRKNFGLPESFQYIIDILYLAICLFRPFRNYKSCDLSIPVRILFVLSLILAVGVLYNLVNPANVLNGFRSQYIAIFVFFACASYLTLNDYIKIFKYFFYFQFLNLGCALYQYTVLGYLQDMNNGAFTSGAGQDIFCGILITYYYYMYMQKKEPLWRFLFVLLSSIFIAVLEEEKFIFIEIIILLFYQVLYSKFSFSKLLLMALICLGIYYGVNNMFDDYSKNALTTADGFIAYTTTSGFGYEFPKIGSSVIIQPMFLTEPLQVLFGLGMGQCEITHLSILDTSFGSRYETFNYYNVPFQILFMQTGWLGVIAFISFFAFLLARNLRNRKMVSKQYKCYYDITNVIIIMCIATIWYNPTLRLIFAFIPYMCMALAPVVTRQINRVNL